MKVAIAVGLGIFMLAAAPLASAQAGARFGASLIGYEETPSTISTTGNGRFDARISPDGSEIAYELSYDALEGDVQQAHIHFGQRGLTGGIVLFLCTNLGNGPAGTQPCPGPRSGSVSGTLTATDVVASAAAQGIEAGNLAEVIQAIRAGAAYVNVHSTKWPSGEIRNQAGPGHSH
jgi:hypothetical protein